MAVTLAARRMAQQSPTPPPAPTGVTLTCEHGVAVVNWNASPGAMYYNVNFQEVSAPYSCTNRGPTLTFGIQREINTPGATVRLKPGATYAFWVNACTFIPGPSPEVPSLGDACNGYSPAGCTDLTCTSGAPPSECGAAPGGAAPGGGISWPIILLGAAAVGGLFLIAGTR